MKARAPVRGQGPTLELARINRCPRASSFPSERQVPPDQDGKAHAGAVGEERPLTVLGRVCQGRGRRAGGHRFPSRLLVPSPLPPSCISITRLKTCTPAPCELHQISPSLAGGGGGAGRGGSEALSTLAHHIIPESGYTEAGRAENPRERGRKVSGNEACSPDFKAHMWGLPPTDSHLPAAASHPIGTRLGPDRDHHPTDHLPAALFLLSHVPTETIQALPAGPPSPRPRLSVQSTHISRSLPDLHPAPHLPM